MRAVIQERYGPSDSLEVREVDRPAVGQEDVLVRVKAASVHPDVWHVVRGRPLVLRLMGAGVARPANPTPGTDMAGVVEDVGRNVTRFRPGDEVFGETIDSHQWHHGGAWAEYVAVPERLLAHKPRGVSLEQAASVPTAGYIVLMNLRDDDRLGPGRAVLVNGAGGGVGSLALQIAKARGAHVTAVDGPGKLDMLRQLGADEVVDYTREDFTRRGVRYHLVFDVPGNHRFSACRRALHAGGRYVLIGHEGFGARGGPVLGIIPYAISLGVRSLFVKQLRAPNREVPTRAEAMAELAGLMEMGRITPVIDSMYPLSDAAEALRHMAEDETLGKVIILP